MLEVMESWGLKYVENFVWVKKGANNRILREDAPYFNKSKLTLLIMRRVCERAACALTWG